MILKTFGERLRKIRNLMGLTQKELSQKAGFIKSNSAAEVRIRQYESNKMLPKINAKQMLAEALNIDISALFFAEISSQEELLHFLFELEDVYKFKIIKKGETYMLSFENLEIQDRKLQSYLDAWYYKQQRLHINLDNKTDYDLWRSKFPIDLRRNEASVDKDIADKYDILKKKLQKEKFNISFLSDFAEIIKSLNTRLKNTKICQNKMTSAYCILSFDDAELLTLDEKSSLEYAKFLLSVEYLNSLNIKIEKKKHTFEEKTYTDFYIYEAPFWTIITSIKEILAIDDKDEAKIRYNSFLNLFNVPITDYRKE